MSGGQPGLDAKLIGFAGFAFADAFDFRRMQGIQLVPVFGLLGPQTFSPFEEGIQPCQVRTVRPAEPLTLDITQHDAEYRPLAAENLAQALELPGMGVAAGTAAQVLGFLGKGLLQTKPHPLSGLDDVIAGDL